MTTTSTIAIAIFFVDVEWQREGDSTPIWLIITSATSQSPTSNHRDDHSKGIDDRVGILGKGTVKERKQNEVGSTGRQGQCVAP